MTTDDRVKARIAELTAERDAAARAVERCTSLIDELTTLMIGVPA